MSVASFGLDGEFPAFFTAKSGFKAPCHVTTAEEAAKMIYVNQVFTVLPNFKCTLGI